MLCTSNSYERSGPHVCGLQGQPHGTPLSRAHARLLQKLWQRLRRWLPAVRLGMVGFAWRCQVFIAVCCSAAAKVRHKMNTLQHTATHCNSGMAYGDSLTATHYNTNCKTMQYTATHYNSGGAYGDSTYCLSYDVKVCMLQHTATHCNTLQHTAPNTATHINHTAIHCNIRLDGKVLVVN